MKNKVKFSGVVILILITLFCFAFAACGDDEVEGNGNGGGGGGGGGGGVPALPGNVTISSTGTSLNSVLTAQYSGTETVSYQWRINNQNITVGGTGSTYIADQPGTYTVVASAEGFASKTSSNAITISAPTPQPPPPPGGLVAYIEASQDSPFNLGNRIFNKDIFENTMSHSHLDVSWGGELGGTGIPYAYWFQIANTSSETIRGLTGTLMRRNISPFNAMYSETIIQKQSIGVKGDFGDPWSDDPLNYNFIFDLPAGQSKWIGVQPVLGINAGYHRDVLRLQYPADPSKFIDLHLQFNLIKAKGEPLIIANRAQKAVAQYTVSGTRIIYQIKVDTVGTVTGNVPAGPPDKPTPATVGYSPEYAIKEADKSTPDVPPPPPVNPSEWIKNGETLTYVTPTTANPTGLIKGGSFNSAGTGNVIFIGLKENTHYWVYSRNGESDNYSASVHLVDNTLAVDKAPLAVSTSGATLSP